MWVGRCSARPPSAAVAPEAWWEIRSRVRRPASAVATFLRSAQHYDCCLLFQATRTMVAGAYCYCRRAYILWCVAQQPSCSCRRAEGRNEEAGVILAYPAADAASRTRWRGRVVACAALRVKGTLLLPCYAESSLTRAAKLKGLINLFIKKV